MRIDVVENRTNRWLFIELIDMLWQSITKSHAHKIQSRLNYSLENLLLSAIKYGNKSKQTHLNWLCSTKMSTLPSIYPSNLTFTLLHAHAVGHIIPLTLVLPRNCVTTTRVLHRCCIFHRQSVRAVLCFLAASWNFNFHATFTTSFWAMQACIVHICTYIYKCGVYMRVICFVNMPQWKFLHCALTLLSFSLLTLCVRRNSIVFVHFKCSKH